MRILVVEDEKRVADFLEEALRGEGYQIQVLYSFPELQNEIQNPSLQFDLAVLDRNLGGADSLNSLKDFKRAFPQSRVLILSAINSANEKALALDLGADDYLTKPYSLSELTARLRALLRRSPQESPQTKTTIQLGNVTMDLLTHTLNINGRRVDLSAKEYQLLVCLIQRPGQIFNKFQLLDRVWDNQLDIESNVVEVTVKNLRRKLEDAKCTLKLSNRRNVGYWLET